MFIEDRVKSEIRTLDNSGVLTKPSPWSDGLETTQLLPWLDQRFKESSLSYLT